MNNYLEKIDRAVIQDSKTLLEESLSFVCVLIIVPIHITILLLRIMFPWLIPFITKEES